MKSLHVTIVSTVAVLILLLAVALPIIQTMSENAGEPVYSANEGGEKMAKAKSLSSAITLAKTADGVTANGTTTTSYMIVASSIAVNVTSNGVSWIHTNGNSDATTGNLSWTTGDTLSFNGTSWNLTPGEGSSTTAASGTYTWIFYPDSAGTYIKTSGPVFVDSGNEIVTAGFLSTTKQAVTTGTISGLSVLYGNPSVVSSTVTITSEKTDYTNTLTSVKVGNATSGQTLIVPVDYTSDMEQGLVGSLVNLIPVILVVALLVGIVYTALLKREE